MQVEHLQAVFTWSRWPVRRALPVPTSCSAGWTDRPGTALICHDKRK